MPRIDVPQRTDAPRPTPSASVRSPGLTAGPASSRPATATTATTIAATTTTAPTTTTAATTTATAAPTTTAPTSAAATTTATAAPTTTAPTSAAAAPATTAAAAATTAAPTTAAEAPVVTAAAAPAAAPDPAGAIPRKRRIPWPLLQSLAGVAVVALLVWRLGSGAFLDGLRMIDAWSLLAAVAVGAATIVACAWRWRLVARGLGLQLPLHTAVADCYRAVLINSTLPGGILGDVDRAVGHGREHGDVARGIRAVVWERTAGQVVQCVLAVALLWAFPSPVQRFMPWIAVAMGALLLALALLAASGSRRDHSGADRQGVRSAVPLWRAAAPLWRRASRTVRTDVRTVLLARRVWPGVVLFSAVAVGGHLATFLVAARTAGLTAPASQLLPLTLLALLAMGLPANIGGFGPREGVAAWAFGAAGLTAEQGVATATVYGVLVLVSSLPGVAVLLFRRRTVAS